MAVSMNAVSNSIPDFIVESDSDTNSEELSEYYQPIATEADEDVDDDPDFQRLPNGYASDCLENGVTSLDLRDEEENGENTSSEKEEEEEEEAARMREVVRAFREDEQRRNAPLTAENSMRVMEAMRGVSFGGTPPDWVNRVPEDQWIHQLTTIHTSFPPSTTSASVQDS